MPSPTASRKGRSAPDLAIDLDSLMPAPDTDQLRSIKSFPALVKYLREELGWPIDGAEVEDLTFDYTADELGLDAKHAARVKEIKQLRPLETNQPWGIFWVSFEKKKLPMVVLRRILGNLVTKNRATAVRDTKSFPSPNTCATKLAQLSYKPSWPSTRRGFQK